MFVVDYIQKIKAELTKIAWTKKEELTSIFFLIILFLVISSVLFSLLDVLITFLIYRIKTNLILHLK